MNSKLLTSYMYMQLARALVGSAVCMHMFSLVPRPFEEEKGPGIHCLRMLRYPKNLGGLDTIVNYSASLIRIPVSDIIVHLPFELICACASYPQTFVFLLCFTCQYFYPGVRCEFTGKFTVSFTENMMHAQTVCTRPFLPLHS